MATIASRKITLNVNLNTTVKRYLPSSWRNLSGFSFSVRGVRESVHHSYEPYTGKIVSSSTTYDEIYGNSNFKTVSLSGQKLSFDVPSSATHVEIEVSYQNDKYKGPRIACIIPVNRSTYYLSKGQTMNKFFGYIADHYCKLFNVGEIKAKLSIIRGCCMPATPKIVKADSFDDFVICHEMGHSISYRLPGSDFGNDLNKIFTGGALDISQYALGYYGKLEPYSIKAVMHLEFPAALMNNMARRKAFGSSAEIDYDYFDIEQFIHGKAVLKEALDKIGVDDNKFKNLMLDIAKTKDWESLKTKVHNFK
jgi:hypothetical protein